MTSKNVLVWMPQNFNISCGGVNVQFELCKILKELGVNVKLYAPVKIKNPIFNDYYCNNDFDLNNTIVIYGETIDGNPLNAPHVVRWILAPMGIFFNLEKTYFWGRKDLVYYFNSEEKICSDFVIDEFKENGFNVLCFKNNFKDKDKENIELVFSGLNA